MEILLLTKLAEELNFKKVDTAKKWCEKNGVPIAGSHGKRWVPANALEYVRKKELMKILIRKYGEEKANRLYQAYQDGNFEVISELNPDRGDNPVFQKTVDYIPQSEASSKFLNEFK